MPYEVPEPGTREVLIETDYTVLSAGTERSFLRVYLKNSLRLHHGVFSAISTLGNLGQSRTISRKG